MTTVRACEIDALATLCACSAGSAIKTVAGDLAPVPEEALPPAEISAEVAMTRAPSAITKGWIESGWQGNSCEVTTLTVSPWCSKDTTSGSASFNGTMCTLEQGLKLVP